jgi:hypothetical protein
LPKIINILKFFAFFMCPYRRKLLYLRHTINILCTPFALDYTTKQFANTQILAKINHGGTHVFCMAATPLPQH